MRMKVLFASLLLAASGQVLAQSSGQVGGRSSMRMETL